MGQDAFSERGSEHDGPLLLREPAEHTGVPSTTASTDVLPCVLAGPVGDERADCDRAAAGDPRHVAVEDKAAG